MVQSWADLSEMTAGLVLQKRLDWKTVRPELFIQPYSDLIEEIQKKNEVLLDDLVEKVGFSAVQTAISAAENINGLSKKNNWGKLLEDSYLKHDVGVKLEKAGRKLLHGEEVDLAKIVESCESVAKGHGNLQRLSEIKPCEVPFIKTGYLPIDHHLGGIPQVGLITVGGNPGVGKTSFLIKLASKFVQEHEDKVALIFTLEMILSEFAMRAIEIDQTLTKEQKDRIIICEDVLTVGELANIAATVKGVGLIGVDFADLLIHGEVTESEMAIVYKSLAALAKRMKVPVVLLAQLARTYQGGVPRPQNLRYTSLAEALSWMILMLYAPSRDFYAENTDATLPIVPGKSYVVCWKCRGGYRVHGSPGAIQLNWRGSLAWSDKVGSWFTLEKRASDDEN